MAGSAATGYRRVIHDGNRTPGECRVAALTQGRGCHMIRWFHGSQHHTNLRVTTSAGRIGALENPARMTSVATNVLVRAVQVKTSAEMIERFLCLNL